jgi:hypothetical protein
MVSFSSYINAKRCSHETGGLVLLVRWLCVRYNTEQKKRVEEEQDRLRRLKNMVSPLGRDRSNQQPATNDDEVRFHFFLHNNFIKYSFLV